MSKYATKKSIPLVPSWEMAARIWLTPKSSNAARIESEAGLMGLGRGIDFIAAGLKAGTITISNEDGAKLNAILNQETTNE